MAEYRLDELARISGVSARNIRAYRERGLLDPPRRVGRSAFYDDYHLSQLRTINQLHRRGFNSAHIAEFFASMRQGTDLADILGIQRAVLGPRPEEGDEDAAKPTQAERRGVDIDPESAEGRKLVDYGLAALSEGGLVLADRHIAEIVARASDQKLYVRALVHIFEATRDAIDDLAGGVVSAFQESMSAQRPDDISDLGQMLQDFRDLWSRVVSDRLEESVQQRMGAVVSRPSVGRKRRLRDREAT